MDCADGSPPRTTAHSVWAAQPPHHVQPHPAPNQVCLTAHSAAVCNPGNLTGLCHTCGTGTLASFLHVPCRHFPAVFHTTQAAQLPSATCTASVAHPAPPCLLCVQCILPLHFPTPRSEGREQKLRQEWELGGSWLLLPHQKC